MRSWGDGFTNGDGGRLMYIPRRYEEKDREKVHAFIRENSFAILVSVLDGVPVGTHIPLLLEKDEQGRDVLVGHIARGNEQKGRSRRGTALGRWRQVMQRTRVVRWRRGESAGDLSRAACVCLSAVVYANECSYLELYGGACVRDAYGDRGGRAAGGLVAAGPQL